MPSATKVRKSGTSRITTASLNKTRGLNTYASVSKGGVSTVDTILEQKNHANRLTPSNDTSVNSRKRKLVEVVGESPQSLTGYNGKFKRHLSCQSYPQTPRNPIPSKGQESSTEGARGLLDKLLISSAPTKSRSGLNPSSPGLPRTPKIALSSYLELPGELIDLINLTSAFLTAFSIHCAHNGTHCPADQKAICEETTRIWRKRCVTIIDLQRILGLINRNIDSQLQGRQRLSRLSISDYGQGKICIEISEVNGNSGKVARPVNPDLLNSIFTHALNTEWGKSESVDTQSFVDNLPLEPVSRCIFSSGLSPLLVKGQRRLESIRGRAKIKMKSETQSQPACESDGKKTTLLERLRAKQLHTKDPIPSKSSLMRKASLGRTEEVSAVLTMISTSSSIGQQRVSFTLPTILERLKDSLNLSRAEGEFCMRLLATEIAPEWIRIVCMKKTDALVVYRSARPDDIEIKERIKRAYMR